MSRRRTSRTRIAPVPAPGPNAIWPRVLNLMSDGGVWTAESLAKALGERRDSVYASMSSLGRMKGRWWIQSVQFWDRYAPFVITERGM